jgi:hypothetical protein
VRSGGTRWQAYLAYRLRYNLPFNRRCPPLTETWFLPLRCRGGLPGRWAGGSAVTPTPSGGHAWLSRVAGGSLTLVVLAIGADLAAGISAGGRARR